MEKREKLEKPIIEFTSVTLLGGSGSNCGKPENDPNPGQATVKFCDNDTNCESNCPSIFY